MMKKLKISFRKLFKKTFTVKKSLNKFLKFPNKLLKDEEYNPKLDPLRKLAWCYNFTELVRWD